MSDFFDNLHEFSKAMNKLYALKRERTKENRIKAQNTPFTKQRKSQAMKRYWENKKKQEQIKLEEEKYRESLTKEELYPSCTCFMGNPPCIFCTETNYCEACDLQTWDDYCSECSKYIGQEVDK